MMSVFNPFLGLLLFSFTIINLLNENKTQEQLQKLKQRQPFGVLALQICFYLLNVLYKINTIGGACGVMVIVAGIGHGDTSSNPGLIAFHIALIPLGKV